LNDPSDIACRDKSGTQESPQPIANRARSAALRLNSRLDSLMPFVTPTGVILGFIFPSVFVRLRPYIPWFFGLITLSSALNLRARDLGAAVASPIPVFGFFVAAHVLMPVVAFLTSRLVLPADFDATAGFVLLYSAPTAIAGFIWISIYRGDIALALALILLDTLAAPFVMPLTTSMLLGAGIALDGKAMAVSLVYMIVAPTIFGVVLNEGSRGAAPRIVTPYLAPLAKIFMALVISANSAAVAPTVDFSQARVWAIGSTGIGITSIAFILGRTLGFLPRIDPARKRGLVFSVGMRNISAVATIAINFFPEAAALPAILGMFFQQTLAAIFGRVLLGKPGDER